MAAVVNKYPQNAAGSLYVDDQCIDCDLCRETAPANFTRNDDGGHSYCINNPKVPRKKRSAKRLWRVVLSKQSAMTASSTLLRLFEPAPKMRTFLRFFLFATTARPIDALWRVTEW